MSSRLLNARTAEEAWIVLDTAQVTYDGARSDYQRTFKPLEMTQRELDVAEAQVEADRKSIHPLIHSVQEGETQAKHIRTWQQCQANKSAKQFQHDILGHRARLTASREFLVTAIKQYVGKAHEDSASPHAPCAKEWLDWSRSFQTDANLPDLPPYPCPPVVGTWSVVKLPELQYCQADQELQKLRSAVLRRCTVLFKHWAATPVLERSIRWSQTRDRAQQLLTGDLEIYVRKTEEYRVMLRHRWRAWSRQLANGPKPPSYINALTQWFKANNEDITFGKQCVEWRVSLDYYVALPSTKPVPVFPPTSIRTLTV